MFLSQLKSLTRIFLLTFISFNAFAAYEYDLKPGVTEVSRQIYSLHHIILWICVAIGVVVFAVMFYALFQHRKAKGVVPAQFHDNTLVEIIWTIVPFFILVAMAIPATKTLLFMHNTDASEVSIKVTGYQWKWKYDYLNEGLSFFSELSTPQDAIYNKQEKGEHYLLEVNNPLVVPIHKKIRFLITANDVLHAWWVPAFGVKKDAIPGFINETWTKIDEPGIYRGQCAELCGRGHGFMPIVVIAKTEEDYKLWVAQQKEAKSQVDLSEQSLEALMTQGEANYNRSCATCHQANGEGMSGAFPALKGSPIATGSLDKHMDIVLRGKPGTAMQAFAEQLNAAELAAVITYERNAWGNNKLVEQNKTEPLVQPAQIQAAKAQKK